MQYSPDKNTTLSKSLKSSLPLPFFKRIFDFDNMEGICKIISKYRHVAYPCFHFVDKSGLWLIIMLFEGKSNTINNYLLFPMIAQACGFPATPSTPVAYVLLAEVILLMIVSLWQWAPCITKNNKRPAASAELQVASIPGWIHLVFCILLALL